MNRLPGLSINIVWLSIFFITVLSGCGGSSSSGANSDMQTNTLTNTPPVANAGPDQTLDLGQTATLTGTNSSDADGDALTYTWSQSSAPAGSSASLSATDVAMPTFTADLIGDYVFSLMVNDASTSSTADDITLSFHSPSTENSTPIANAGPNQTVTTGDTVSLDGTASSDADGDPLTYTWVFISIPNGSLANLQNHTDNQPSFVADISGNYVISLVVGDRTTTSAAATVTIVAGSSNIDITNIYFSNKEGTCSSYVGSYFSTVTDVQRGIDFAGDIQVTNTNDNCTISSNEIPNHDFNDSSASFASNVTEQSSNYVITASPQIAAEVTQNDLRYTNVVFLNGVTVDLLAAACYGVGNDPLGREKIGCGPDQINNPWRYDPMSPLNTFGTDIHNAHVQPDGTYHYHGNPVAMFDQDCDINATSSPVIGFAADGFPVYGSCFTDPVTNSVRKAQSSFVLKDNAGARQTVSGYITPVAGQGDVASGNYDGQFIGDYEYIQGQGDLDECNGMTIDGQYGYYITDAYPWVLACYKGTVGDSFVKGGPALQNALHRHEPEQANLSSEEHTHGSEVHRH